MIASLPSSFRTKLRPVSVAAALLLCASGAWGWSASGTVKTSAGTPISGVAVSVQDSAASLSTTTNDSGKFSIIRPTGVGARVARADFSMGRDGNDLVIRMSGEGVLDLVLTDLAGAQLWTSKAYLNQGMARVAIPSSINATTGILQVRQREVGLARSAVFMGLDGIRMAPEQVAARTVAAPYPTLVFKKTGYKDATYAMTGETASNIAIVMTAEGGDTSSFVEDHRSECTLPTLPAASGLTSNAFLPNPFKMHDGTAITKKSQWKCRREEIAAMVEKYVAGEKPRNPEKVTGAFSGNTLTVSVTDKGKTVSFKVTIGKPTTGSAPYAAIIGYGGGNVKGGYSSLPVATISYTPFDLASEGSGRGKGVFYDLYGSNHTASELMAQAWGVSRIIDALLVTPAAGIDPKRIGVTGCSRYGKGAILAGAFDQRIKLTIPQESGSGGVAAWRMIPTYSDAQPISSTYSEAYWTRQDFLTNFGSAPGKLPHDNHEMISMVAPNGLLILDNSIAWLGPKAGYGTAVAAKEIFTALGQAQAITYSSVGGHDHCALPTSQNHWVQSYAKQYLLGQTGETAKMEAPADYTFDRAKWINWTTPTLE